MLTFLQLRVFYIGPNDADLLETQRLIHRLLRPVSTQIPSLACSKGVKSSNVIPAPVEVGSRLSLVDRNQQWSRWCSPQTENPTRRKQVKDGSPPSGIPAGPATQAMHGKLAFDTVKSFFKAPDDTSHKLCNNNSPYWAPEIEHHDSVKLGQVLFPADKAKSIANALEQNRKKTKKTGHKPRPNDIPSIRFKSAKIPRVFLPLVPGLVRSLENLGSLEKSEEFLQIRLSPSSKNASLPVPINALPDLEIMIFTDHDRKTTSIKDVRLVTGKEKDFLQPENVVDLRFIRNQYVYAKDDCIDPCILSFVQDSNLDIWGTGSLKAPLDLSLSIPALAIRSHNGFDPKSYETLLVNYAYFGLEHRSSLTIPYQDRDSWPTLTYTNIEAGRIGGSRDELSLHSLRFVSKQLPRTDPESAAVSIDEESLSDDDHTAILFQKTADLIESIELAGMEKSAHGLTMPEIRRRRSRLAAKVRKADPFEGKAQQRPGYVAPVNDTVRRVIADHMSQTSKPVSGRRKR